MFCTFEKNRIKSAFLHLNLQLFLLIKMLAMIRPPLFLKKWGGVQMFVQDSASLSFKKPCQKARERFKFLAACPQLTESPWVLPLKTKPPWRNSSPRLPPRLKTLATRLCQGNICICMLVNKWQLLSLLLL